MKTNFKLKNDFTPAKEMFSLIMEKAGHDFLNALAVETNLSLNTSRFSQKFAFTLAEVLITLAIIGVVAALTIPTLISKTNNLAFETALKKQVSVIQNQINYATFNDNLSSCYITVIKDPDPERPNNSIYNSNNEDCQAIKHSLVTNMKLTPITNYSKIYNLNASTIKNQGGISANWTVDYSVIKRSEAYLSPDGTVLFIHNPAIFIIIDVNGEKGPNKWGYDVFWLTMVKNPNNGTLRLSDEYSTLVEKGGKLPRDILQNKKEPSTQESLGKNLYGRY